LSSAAQLAKQSALTKHSTIMGFDFGEKRIGVATGNLSIGLAAPLTTIHAASNVDRLAAIAKLFTEWQPAQFVVGQPRHADDQPHEIAHLAKKFGNRLQENFKRPVVYIDETLSGREQKDKLDAFAAAVILQSWMNEYALTAAANNETKANHAA
jgi:putative Holliday junction resolvase